jgi:lipopolysaccharide transport system ATP-binding protein
VVRGAVAPLIELGAGFHPELTGRENVFLNAALLGLSQAETAARFSEIVDFAELWDFIDAPVRTYSTGMYARLGFAVATAYRPEILLVDEILAVGDQGFQEKCRERMNRFRDDGTTVVLVSHSPDTVVTMCDQAVWLDAGRIRAIGAPTEVVAEYAAWQP